MMDFINTKNFISYTIGKNAYKKINEICTPYGKNVLIIGGKTALSKTKEKLIPELSTFNIVDFCIYGVECSENTVNKIVNKYKNIQIDFIFAVGGGKAIDTVKCVAEILNKPFFSFPTLASNCAASSALSVMYDDNHKCTELKKHSQPAKHCFIDTNIIFDSPFEYFRAGIGDTFAKYYEVEFSMRGKKLTFEDSLGKSISELCKNPLIDYALNAINDFRNKVESNEFICVISIIIISTGMVSMLINPEYNGAVAHALFYGLTTVEGFEENNRHGDVVAYGIVVMLLIDKKYDEAKNIFNLLKFMKVKTSLKDMGINIREDVLKPIIISTLNDQDMKTIPYQIIYEDIYNAILEVENKFN